MLKLSIDSQPDRAAENGVSRSTQQNLDWLARNAPDHLERVKHGEISVHRACIEAGKIKVKTRLEAIIALWGKLDTEEIELTA